MPGGGVGLFAIASDDMGLGSGGGGGSGFGLGGAGGGSAITVGVYFAGASKTLLHDGQVISRPAKSSGTATGFMHDGQKSFGTDESRGFTTWLLARETPRAGSRAGRSAVRAVWPSAIAARSPARPWTNTPSAAASKADKPLANQRRDHAGQHVPAAAGRHAGVAGRVAEDARLIGHDRPRALEDQHTSDSAGRSRSRGLFAPHPMSQPLRPSTARTRRGAA